jgi:putative membrane protein
VGLVLLAVYVAIYVRVTPYREIALIRAGNMAAAYSLSGAVIGFVIPLASAIEHSVGLADMAIWGLIAMLVQLAAFVAVRITIPTITRDIPAGQTAQGFFLGAIAIAVGMLNAACMSY